MTNINIADSIRDKSLHRGGGGRGSRKGSNGGGGGDSPEEQLFGVTGGRRKPSTSTLQSNVGEERESRRTRKERNKKFRGT